MVRTDERYSVREPGRPAVPERRQWYWIRPAQLPPGFKICLEGDESQGHDDSNFFQSLQFLQQVGPAIRCFRRQWFVIRRAAMNRGRDVAVDQAQAIVAMYRSGLIGEAEFVEGPIQPVA